MGPLQKGLEQTELRHDVEGRRMDRITAKVAEKVAVFFQQDGRTPARARSSPAIIPAGPPPTMQQSYFVSVTATTYCSNGSVRTPLLAGRRRLGPPSRSRR